METDDSGAAAVRQRAEGSSEEPVSRERIAERRAERKAEKSKRKDEARRRAASQGMQVRGPGADRGPSRVMTNRPSVPGDPSPTGNWFCPVAGCEHHDHASPVTRKMTHDGMAPRRCPVCRCYLVPAAHNGLPTWYDADFLRESKRFSAPAPSRTRTPTPTPSTQEDQG